MPVRNQPRSLIISIVISFCCNFGMPKAQTLSSTRYRLYRGDFISSGAVMANSGHRLIDRFGGSHLGIMKGSSFQIGTQALPDHRDLAIPSHFSISQNYPNPFNQSTFFHIAIPRSSHVELTIYSSLGQQIRTLITRALEPGSHVFQFDGRDWNGQTLPTGVYFIRMTTKEFTKMIKFTILK